MLGRQDGTADDEPGDAALVRPGLRGQLDVVGFACELDAPEDGRAAPGDDRMRHQDDGRPGTQDVRHRDVAVYVHVGE